MTAVLWCSGSTQDSDKHLISCDPGSIPGRTFTFFFFWRMHCGTQAIRNITLDLNNMDIQGTPVRSWAGPSFFGQNCEGDQDGFLAFAAFVASDCGLNLQVKDAGRAVLDMDRGRWARGSTFGLAVMILHNNELERWRHNSIDLSMYAGTSFQSHPATDNGTGVFGVSAYYAATTQLQAVRKASEVTEEEAAPELISQHTEDGIPRSIRMLIHYLIPYSRQEPHSPTTSLLLKPGPMCSVSSPILPVKLPLKSSSEPERSSSNEHANLPVSSSR